MANREQQTNNRQIHENDQVSLEIIFEILDKLGLNLVTKKCQDEKVDIKVVISASDEDLIRLVVRTIGNRIILREACKKNYTAYSSLRPLDSSQEISTNRLGLVERSFLFSPSFGRNNGSRQKKGRSMSRVLLVAVIEGQQIGMDWSVYVSFGHPCEKNTHSNYKSSPSEGWLRI